MIYKIAIFFSFVILWQGLITLFKLPPYILPTPLATLTTLIQQLPVIAHQALPTLAETMIGLFLAILLGMSLALSLIIFRWLRPWLKPFLVVSQALPTFAIAPLLVIWFGYGLASKIITVILMLFFPITQAFFDGLQRTPLAWLDLASNLNASAYQILWKIRVPAALPQLASGLRLATAAAPLSAVLSEWVGSSQGLGFLMMNANARMQVDLVFAVLLIIFIFSLGLYTSVDRLLKYIIFWSSETA